MTTPVDTNPIGKEEASVPVSTAPISNSDENKIHVIPTITTSASFDSAAASVSPTDAASNKIFGSYHSSGGGAGAGATTIVKISPTNQNPNPISNPNSQHNPVGRSSSAASMVSVASGEIILSDSNDTNSASQPDTSLPGGQEQRLQSLATTATATTTTNTGDDNGDTKKRLDSPSSSTEGSGDEIRSEYSEESEEDDAEVLLAKEMALAIAKNPTPTMTPSQLRELQERVQQKVNERSLIKAEKKKSKKSKSFSAKHLSAPMKEAYKETKQKSKDAYKETKQNAKAAYKETKESAKAGAKVVKKEFKKVLRTMQKSGTGSGLVTTTQSGAGAAAPTATTMDTLSSHSTITSGGNTKPKLEEDGETIRLAGTIWKRRSGLGKYSMTAPWERRRVVLKGTKLIYYKTLQETQVGGSDEDGDLEDADDTSHSEIDTNPVAVPSNSGGSFSSEGWINTFMDKTGVTIPWETTQAARGARGYIDLCKEKAYAGASYGHTGAPTPFALSIKVATTTKFKFCFDTQQELMQWLAAITDVVVGGSVDAFNAEILEANDPSSHGGGGGATDAVTSAVAAGLATATGWETSPRNAVNAARNGGDGGGGGGQMLWSTEDYYLVSSGGDASGKPLPFGSNADADGDADGDSAGTVGGSPEDYTVDESTGEKVLAIPSKYVEPMFYLMNAIVLGTRADHGLSEDWFWYVLVFFNVMLVMTVNKTTVGGTISLKQELVGATRRQTKKNNKRIKKKGSSKRMGGLSTINSMDGDAGLASDTVAAENFIPPAGSTAIRIENTSDLPEKDGVIFAGWREVEASELMVRGCGYKANKTKVPCPQSLYKCVDLDIFESKKRVPDMAGRVVLPSTDFKDDEGPKTWNAPDRFVITVALPTDPPKLYGGSTDNGGGYTITMYCVMRQETRDILKRVTADGYNPATDTHLKTGDPNKSMVNAVRLFDEWCRRAPSDDNWMARFKVVPQGNNLAEIGLPAWISNYNGKPFLIKRPGTTGFLYRHPDKSCMEFDVSLHPFPYLAKQGICYMKEGFFKNILATLAFCIEGRSDDELPECLIGLFQLCYPNPVHALQAEEFFAGKTARSK